VDADLKAYFDTIPHDRLMELVAQRVVDGNVLRLVKQYLKAGVLDELQGWQPTERGTPQGAVISPLLANLYLTPLDHDVAGKGWEMVRYADDFVVLCRTREEAEAVLAYLRAWTEQAGLTLHPTKTRIVDAQAEGFDFLGWHFRGGKKWPRQKSLQKLQERLRALGLAGTELARAQAGTIRLKLLKIGAVVLRNTRRVKLLLSSGYPDQEVFLPVAGD
jgi:RNA-directed DNA polymerase